MPTTWRRFADIRAFAQSLKLRNSHAWYAWWKEHDRPADIPSKPDRAYAEDWAGWEDFLGDSYVNTQGKKKKAYRSFIGVRTYVRSLKLKNSDAWRAWWKEHDRPDDIPSDPSKAYAGDWAGWEDFLGDSYVNDSNNRKRVWRSFTVARTFAQGLKLKNEPAWKAWWKKHDRPADIPSTPSKAYAGDWAGWEDFLGDSYVNDNNNRKRVWRSFTVARTYAQSLKLKNSVAWYAWWKEHDRPADIPSDPYTCKAYAADWAGWEDFLGDSYGKKKKKKAWRSFTVARAFAQSLKLKNSVAWEAWWKEHDRPADIPSSLDRAYAEDWAGWEDFLGDSYVNSNPNKKKAWRSFVEVRAFAQSLKLKNSDAWRAWWKEHDRPADIPSDPSQCKAYAEDWAGWEDFLGDSYLNNSSDPNKKKSGRKRERGKVRKRARTSESESAAKKKRKKKKRKRKHHHHHQRMETTTVEGEGRQKSNKPFARV